MSVSYTLVQWNRHKKVYDGLLLLGVLLYIALFMALGTVLSPDRAVDPATLLIRALGTCAIILLHLILCIGPLARIDPRFAPLLYNRRHMGVTMFLLGLGHAAVAIGWYHAFGQRPVHISLLTSSSNYTSLRDFPFEVLGIGALLILFVMAATSHDFWLKNLSPRFWKSLHMFVYVAWGLLIMHVALGALQSERSPLYVVLLGLGVLFVSGLHIKAAMLEMRRDGDRRGVKTGEGGWVDACAVGDIPEKRARTVCLPGSDECVAIFRYDGKVSAVSNTCAHQGGPLGEGEVIDGCITCPWHGYQYRPGDGCSPPPYTEKITTYEVRIEGSRVLVNPEGRPPGTPVDPAEIGEGDG